MRVRFFSSRKIVSFLALVGSLCNYGTFSAVAMEHGDENASFDHKGLVPLHHESLELDESFEYPPAFQTGVPQFYSTTINREEWDTLIKNLILLSETLLNPSIKIKIDNSINIVRDAFCFYTDLQQKRFVKQLKQKNQKFFNPLFSLVIHFEGLHDALRTANNKKGQRYQKELDALVHPVQKFWNYCMKEWEVFTGQTSSPHGSLNFSKKDDDGYVKHLYYMRDSNGFLIFPIFPHQKVNGSPNLYKTYVSYGERSDLFNERTILFYSNNDVIQVESRPGFMIENRSDLIYLTPYTGEIGHPSLTTKNSLIFFHKWGESKPPVPIIKEMLTKTKVTPGIISAYKKSGIPLQLNENQTLSTTILSNSGRQIIHSMENFARNYLENSPSKFFGLFKAASEYKEWDYLFLRALEEQAVKTPADENVLFSLAYVREEFSGQSIEEIKEKYENELLTDYIDEEKEKIRAEQLQRSQMVANNAHYSQNNKKTKNKKRQNKKRNSTVRQDTLPPLNEEMINNEAYKRAQERLKDLQKGSKNLTYREHLQMINSVVKSLRECGVSVSGSLNKSSHGALVVGNETLPHHRAHKGQSISRKATFTMCQDLLKKYFSQLRPQANLNKTAISED